MYGNADAALLWLILMTKYIINKFNLKRSKANSCIFFEKYEKVELELVISFHVDGVFMASNPETLKFIKENKHLRVRKSKESSRSLL